MIGNPFLMKKRKDMKLLLKSIKKKKKGID